MATAVNSSKHFFWEDLLNYVSIHLWDNIAIIPLRQVPNHSSYKELTRSSNGSRSNRVSSNGARLPLWDQGLKEILFFFFFFFWGGGEGKTCKKFAKFFWGLYHAHKKYISRKKPTKIAHSSSQQWSEQSTDAYVGSQPPTRWST